MRKRWIVVILTILDFILINSISASSLSDLSSSQLKKYNSLSAKSQAKALSHLQDIGNFDKKRTFLDSNGHFYIVDDSLEDILRANGLKLPPLTPILERKLISNNPPSGYTKEGVPIFHSFPGSNYVIYLNFIGGPLTGRAWNNIYGNPNYSTQPYVPLAYNPNRTPGFPPAVQNAIAGIWARVAEDYSPWQVDVTTERPASFDGSKLEALITSRNTADGKPMPSSTSGGIAYVDIFGRNYTQQYSPALIYYDNLSNGNESAVAEAVSHEIGHNFGLSHNGIIGGSNYWKGVGSGEISWGCIMGGAYFINVVKFCKGDYPNANNKEDQLAIISRQIPYRILSGGNSIETATPLSIINGKFKYSGILEQQTSSNFFSLNSVTGKIQIDAKTLRRNVDTLGNNLCLGVKLFNSTGALIASNENAQTCSAGFLTNTLPLGDYFIQVYAIGNPATSIPIYGSVGQYDLSGGADSNAISLLPTFTTLALNSKITFDANDTVRVKHGTPPYTFSAVLNPISQSGSTFIYTALKPGMDTVTVRDSKGKTTRARITVSLIDFGGMYGGSKIGNYNNPITGTFGCPSGYVGQQIMGTTNLDYPLYYCIRMHKDGVEAEYDFGGAFSGSSSGIRVNPATGGGSCPAGYQTVQVYGESSNQPDYPVYFCYKRHDESIPEGIPFAGMYAPAAFTNYNNPFTKSLSCPIGTTPIKMLDTYYVDYSFYFCSYTVATLTLKLPYTDLALNDTMSFNANDTSLFSGGFPPYTITSNFGNLKNIGSAYTYTASKPGLDTVTMTDSRGNSAKINISTEYIDFGGMFGFTKVMLHSNPITNGLSCPPGYITQQIMGSPGIDNPAYYCYRFHKKGIPAEFEFAGMYSLSSTYEWRSNPVTGGGCDPQYASDRFFGDDPSRSPVDFNAFFCYRKHDPSVATATNFGGMFAPAAGKNYDNPLTGNQSCPSWSKQSPAMLNSPGIDYPLYFCY